MLPEGLSRAASNAKPVFPILDINQVERRSYKRDKEWWPVTPLLHPLGGGQRWGFVTGTKLMMMTENNERDKRERESERAGGGGCFSYFRVD